MKRGQSTLEYIILIGVVAAAIIAVIVYASRGHQGHLRSQADQLSTEQYAPGNSTINNSEAKTLSSVASSGSATTVKHPDTNDVNEPNLLNKDELEGVAYQLGYLYQYYSDYEVLLVHGYSGAEYARANGLPIPASVSESQKMSQILDKIAFVNAFKAAAQNAQATWPTRNPNQTKSGSSSSESGTSTSHKDISETLGNL
jgi:hypothetical protein